MVILITLLLSYIFLTQHILGPQTYRTEDTKIGLQYTHADTRQFKQKRRRERSKRSSQSLFKHGKIHQEFKKLKIT